MFIEKEPAKAAEAKKVRDNLQKEPAPAPVRKKGLQEMGFEDQNKALSARKPVSMPRAPTGGDPVTEVRRLFRENDLPETLVPTNLVDFRHDAGSGALTLTLQTAFSRKFDDQNTVRVDRVVSGVLQKGSFSGITGITRGSAAIVAMSRSKPGVVAIRGRVGPIGKSMEFRDEALPSLP